MAAKRSRHVRHFLRAAGLRYEEAAHMREYGYTLVAAYLGGYAAECALKALILSTLDEHGQPARIRDFRGVVAHDLGWLLGQYRAGGGAAPPREVGKAIGDLSKLWDTSLRYNPTRRSPAVDDVLDMTDRIVKWAEGRL